MILCSLSSVYVEGCKTAKTMFPSETVRHVRSAAAVVNVIDSSQGTSKGRSGVRRAMFSSVTLELDQSVPLY